MNRRILIVGGGAAGYFAALRAAELQPEARIVIAEAGKKPLQKVAISGGGRCNVTHACFDVLELITRYPRGSRELRGPFSRFQPRDTIAWFEQRGVSIKEESDGRCFPVTDNSQTIIDCFERERNNLGITLRTQTKVTGIESVDRHFVAAFKSRKSGEEVEHYDSVMLATGSAKSGHTLLQSLGHTLEPCVPSLFTFEVDDTRLEGLAGVSVQDAGLSLSIEGVKTRKDRGPILITHWGFSGPAVIRLSAWGARDLYNSGYKAQLGVCWLGSRTRDEFQEALRQARTHHKKKSVANVSLLGIPKRLWSSVCSASKIDERTIFAELTKKQVAALERELFEATYRVDGKGVFKEEFVTCGGLALKEIDFRTMESKIVPDLYFGGEILNIDGITGGYNFQNAWTGGYLAGTAMGEGGRD